MITLETSYPSKIVAAKRALALATVSALTLVLPGCQGITGMPPATQVRIIDASPDAPGLDIYQGTGVLAYNLGLGTITSYIAVMSGTYSIMADSAGTRQHLVSTRGTFLTGGQYTVLVGNYSDSLHELVLKDQTQPAPSGKVDLRIIDQSTRAGALDLYLVPTGSTILTVRPMLTNIAFNANTGYLSVPAGTYTLIALPAGTIPTAATVTSYTGSAIAYSSGSVRTIVLIDQQLATTLGIQAIVATDVDPTNTAN